MNAANQQPNPYLAAHYAVEALCKHAKDLQDRNYKARMALEQITQLRQSDNPPGDLLREADKIAREALGMVQ